MEKLNLCLENCHGINKMEYTFDFSTQDYIIYAINGTMKTSLYKTFDDYKSGKETIDAFFPDRITIREIRDENGVDVDLNSIILIGNEDYNVENKKVTALLINEELKVQYDSIFSMLSEKSEAIEKKIKQKSGSTIDILLRDLSIRTLQELPEIILDGEEIINDFGEIKYNKIFNDDNKNILNQEVITEKINEYISTVNSVISEHQEFIKDTFELHNLKSVVKNLESQGYFTAGHLVKMKKSRTEEEYKEYDQEEINNFISEIEQLIITDTRIAAVNVALTNKVKSIELNTLLSQNSWIIPHLSDLQLLAQNYWKYIIHKDEEIITLIREYLSIYISSKDDLERITLEANSSNNYERWDHVIEIFNNKFINMPFKLRVSNISDVILKNSVCSLKYEYNDGRSTNPDVDENILKNNLSKGEKKAFNILNLIFEIEYRKLNGINSLLIVDDIADSFDYKNKYAIVEYLKEINIDSQFKMIIMTHNFDFYRTCANSLSLHRLNSVKGTNIVLQAFSYRKNVFSHFKENINQDMFFLASIPFVRNIIELSRDDRNLNYLKLTSALHYKQDTDSLTVQDINNIYTSEINKTAVVENSRYLDKLFNTANSLTSGNTIVKLENKLVLSIAIRLKFEIFMFSRINDWTIINDFSSNQTAEMIKYCILSNLFSHDERAISDKVTIMTSENIHVNAFMYEPIIDMSDDELITLYNIVKTL